MSEVSTYSLGVVLRETGINADTLRAWERRYGLPQPARSEGGQRLYSLRDIEIIKWLLQRQEEGIRIGQAVKLWETKIAQGENPLSNAPSLLKETPTDASHFTSFKEIWIAACLSFNEGAAEEIANEAFSRVAPERAFQEIFIPAIRQIGDLWYRGEATVQQEHFASALLARRLDALIAAAPAPTRPEKVIIGCPPKEEHTLSLLLSTLYLRRRGFNVIYLGANIPLNQIAETARELQPQLLILAAQQLTTAATLAETTYLLAKTNIPVAYGGRIFNSVPALREKISGHFLGEILAEALRKAETLLTQQITPLRAKEDQNPYQALQGKFSAELLSVHIYLKTALSSWEMPLNTFYAANNFLSANILAALQLGDLDFLRPELSWARSLLKYHKIVEVSITEYWIAYAKSVEQAIGAEATPLVEWLLEEASR